MKVFIAAPWVHRPLALEAKKLFEIMGHEVRSTWITVQRSFADMPYDEQMRLHGTELAREAQQDLQDIQDSDIFVILNSEKSEGKSFEFGFAYSSGMPIIGVGESRTRNLYYLLPEVMWAQNVMEAIALVNRLERRGNEDVAEAA